MIDPPLAGYTSLSLHQTTVRASFRLLPISLLAAAGLLACRIETRPPAEVERVQATVQAAVNEHYRARGALAGDSAAFRVTRRQTEVRRDLASVWTTVRHRERMSPDSLRDTTRYEHLLLRRSDGGWIVLSATGVTPP